MDAQDAKPLAGALVLLRSETHPDEQSQTDRLGRWTTLIPVARAVSLQVTCAGYATKTTEVLAQGPKEVSIRLERNGHWLSGWVSDVSGNPVSGVTVCAWAADRIAPNLAEILSGEEKGTRDGVTWGPSRRDGSFELIPGTLNSELTVAAGGQGWISPSAETTTPGSEPVNIEVFPLHGCALRWRDEQTGDLRTSPLLSRSRGEAAEIHNSWARKVDRDWPGLGIAGFSYDDLWERPPTQSLYLFVDTQAGQADEIGPLVLRKSIPGYEAKDLSIPLPRVLKDVPIIDVELSPATECWCRTTVAIVPPCAGDGGRFATLPRATVFLENEQSGKVLRFSIGDFAREELVLGGVPCGLYEMRWKTDNGYFDCRGTGLCGGRVDLTGPEATLLVDASPLGCLECVVVDGQGKPYQGLLLIDAGRISGDQRWWSSTSWREPPYLLEDLPAGRYDLVVRYPPALRGVSLSGVSVHSSERTLCTLVR